MNDSAYKILYIYLSSTPTQLFGPVFLFSFQNSFVLKGAGMKIERCQDINTSIHFHAMIFIISNDNFCYIRKAETTLSIIVLIERA